jgi:hypothetical protein
MGLPSLIFPVNTAICLVNCVRSYVIHFFVQMLWCDICTSEASVQSRTTSNRVKVHRVQALRSHDSVLAMQMQMMILVAFP